MTTPSNPPSMRVRLVKKASFFIRQDPRDTASAGVWIICEADTILQVERDHNADMWLHCGNDPDHPDNQGLEAHGWKVTFPDGRSVFYSNHPTLAGRLFEQVQDTSMAAAPCPPQTSLFDDPPQPGTWYSHWKGQRQYKILSVAQSADAGETIVVYESINRAIQWWRTLSDFMGTVPIERFRKDGADWEQGYTAIPDDATTVKRFTKIDTPTPRARWNRSSWACVSDMEKPKDSRSMWVVRVLEDPGHVGPVTRLSSNKVFVHVHGGVHDLREDARRAKEKAREALGTWKYTAREHYGGD